jgi:hypothetical protein
MAYVQKLIDIAINKQLSLDRTQFRADIGANAPQIINPTNKYLIHKTYVICEQLMLNRRNDTSPEAIKGYSPYINNLNMLNKLAIEYISSYTTTISNSLYALTESYDAMSFNKICNTLNKLYGTLYLHSEYSKECFLGICEIGRSCDFFKINRHCVHDIQCPDICERARTAMQVSVAIVMLKILLQKNNYIMK